MPEKIGRFKRFCGHLPRIVCYKLLSWYRLCIVCGVVVYIDNWHARKRRYESQVQVTIIDPANADAFIFETLID